MGKTMDNPVSPKTGAQMQRGMSSMTLEYKGARTTFDMPGWYCDASDESIHTGCQHTSWRENIEFREPLDM